MKKKIIIDIIMTIFMILLMKITFLNFKLHELIGVITFVLFIIHKLYNLNTIKQTIKKWKRLPKITKIGFILDLIIFINFIILFFSSIMISDNIFSFLNIKSPIMMSNLHHLTAHTLLIFISIHIGFHFENILNMAYKLLKIDKENKVYKYTTIIISIVIILFGIKVMLNNNFYKHLLKPFGYKEKEITKEVSIKNAITLEEYLKDKRCDGCPRHCLLTNLRCSRGSYYLELAKNEYNRVYNKEIEINNNKVNINTSLNVLDYFMVMSSIVGITHYILKTKNIKK